jgi:hypothetical protein
VKSRVTATLPETDERQSVSSSATIQEAPPQPDAAAGRVPANLLALQQSAGNVAVARFVRAQTARAQEDAPEHEPIATEPESPVKIRASAAVVQRYQAGEEGHGGIEAAALGPGGAGLSPDEARQVYSGNWLRDLSQLNSPAMLPIIRILYAGEFGTVPDASALGAELGQYVPSEHLDNPEGGDTVEDPRATPARRQELYNQLSPDQQAAFDAEERHSSDILHASAHSQLPPYVERGKLHSKEKLKEAIVRGRNPEGFQLMGDALHAVEDYYSHSNFVEACILALEARGDPSAVAYAARLKQTYLGGNRAMLVPHDASGRAQIQTGTYAGDANKQVSRLELIQTELSNGELTRSLIKGWVLVNQIEAQDLFARLGGGAGGSLGGALGLALGGAGGAVAGGVQGAVGGAASGAESGFAAGERLGGGGILGGVLGAGGAVGGALLGGVSGLFGGAAEGAAAGAREGAAAGSDLGRQGGAAVGGAAGLTVGTILGVASTALLVATLGPIVVPIAIAAIAAAKAGLLERLATHETAVSGGEARSAGLSGPTHSELAKDDPEHPLFAISRAMAVAADTEIGQAMIAAWAGQVHVTTDAARPLDAARGGAPPDGGGQPGGGDPQGPSPAEQHANGNGNGDGAGKKRTKAELYAEVDRRFWERYPKRAGQKLKLDDPDDKPYIQAWVKIRREVEQEDGGGATESPGGFMTFELEEVLISSDGGGAGGTSATAAQPAPAAQQAPAPDASNAQAAGGVAPDMFGAAETPQQQAVLELVDKYVCHPDQTDWWEAVIHST